MTDVKWPRYWYNYPIILCGISLMYIWVIGLVWDQKTLNVTVLNTLLPYLHIHEGPFYSADWDYGYIRWVLILILTAIGSLSFLAFRFKKKIETLLCLVPQQFVMMLCSGGVIHSIFTGTFADGTVRNPAFLFADQMPTVILTVFHTWALILILLHGTDEH